MKRHIATVLAAMCAFPLLLALLLTCVEFMTYNENFYQKEYFKYERPQAIGITEGDLMDVTHGLIDYLKGDREELDMVSTIQGQIRPVFNELDRFHMVDVKGLYDLLRASKIFCFALFGLLFLGALLLAYPLILPTLSKGILIGAGAMVVLTCGLAIFISMDFNFAFTLFHHLSFNNDGWLLDPMQSVLINMVPLEFFVDIAASIGLLFAGMTAILVIICVLLLIFKVGGPARTLSRRAARKS